MKKYGAVIALVLAVVSGLSAVWLANRWMGAREVQQPVAQKPSVLTTEVVIAARDQEVGSRLTSDSLTLVEWPAATAPRGAFKSASDLEGRVLVTRLRAGLPVLAADLAAPGTGPGLVATIHNGKRAMAVRVDEVVGVGGFVLPETYVDVIAVTRKDDKTMKARTLLERIKVLAVAQETFTEDGKPKIVKTVTLEVEPEQAERLARQTHEGPIHLVLRKPTDEVAPPQPPQEPPPVVAVATKKPVPVLKPRVRVPSPEPHVVQVIRGSKSETIQFKHIESEERVD